MGDETELADGLKTQEPRKLEDQLARTALGVGHDFEDVVFVDLA